MLVDSTPPLDLPPLDNCTVFPYPESNHLEFKRCHQSCTLQKIYETICAILNSGGGYIIIGVEDETRRIIGVKCNKAMDTFILNIDNIFHRSIIVKCKDSSPLTIKLIRAEYVSAAESKKLLVITIVAEKGELYCLKDGTVWHRLNASNYRQTGLERMYSESEFNGALKERVKEAIQEQANAFRSEKDKLMYKFKMLEEDLKQIVASAKGVDEERAQFNKMLYRMILQQKEGAEKALASGSTTGFWLSLLSYLCCS